MPQPSKNNDDILSVITSKDRETLVDFITASSRPVSGEAAALDAIGASIALKNALTKRAM